MIDEPLVVPVSPGTAIVRLSQVIGALGRNPAIASILAGGAMTALQKARQDLIDALEQPSPQLSRDALAAARSALLATHEALSAIPPCDRAAGYLALGFPDPAARRLEAVDVSKVYATFTKPERQVLTTLAFPDAGGATAYWLREIRELRGEAIEDMIVESYAPQFSRLRMPLGPHRLRIESRNPGAFIISAEFTVVVPPLK